MCVTHQPGAGHEAWLERKRRNKRNREASRENNNNSSSTTSSNANSGGPQLVLNDQMRQALLTHHGFDEIQMQAIEDAACLGN